MVGKLTLTALIIQTSLTTALSMGTIDITQYLLGTLGDLIGITIAYKVLSRRIDR